MYAKVPDNSVHHLRVNAFRDEDPARRTRATIRRRGAASYSRGSSHRRGRSLVLPLVVSKQLQVDGIRQCVVSQVVWVPVVSAIVESTDLGRGSGIT